MRCVTHNYVILCLSKKAAVTTINSIISISVHSEFLSWIELHLHAIPHPVRYDNMQWNYTCLI